MAVNAARGLGKSMWVGWELCGVGHGSLSLICELGVTILLPRVGGKITFRALPQAIFCDGNLMLCPATGPPTIPFCTRVEMSSLLGLARPHMAAPAHPHSHHPPVSWAITPTGASFLPQSSTRVPPCLGHSPYSARRTPIHPPGPSIMPLPQEAFLTPDGVSLVLYSQSTMHLPCTA